MIATEVPTDIPKNVSTMALLEAESSITMPATTAFSASTTGE